MIRITLDRNNTLLILNGYVSSVYQALADALDTRLELYDEYGAELLTINPS